MTDKEKLLAGVMYNATSPDVADDMKRCWDKCYDYNALRPSQWEERTQSLKSILGYLGDNVVIQQPFHCDLGYRIEIGDNSYLNFNCTILDSGGVKIGKNVFIAPNCGIYTPEHPLDVERRNVGLEIGLPITIGDNVWIGGNETIVGGVTIGNNTVIGAGSVVTRSIPDNVIAFGNPCKVYRKITEEDKERYK